MTENKKIHSITPTIIVTNNDIDDIMATALEGGINYWADQAETVGTLREEDKDLYISETISRGYTVEIHDAEEGEIYQLDLEKLLNGITYGVQNGFVEINNGGTIDTGDIDAIAADVIIQAALFGDVIYG